MKPLLEWKWPTPISNEWEDEFDFKCSIFWLIFIIRFMHNIIKLIVLLEYILAEGYNTLILSEGYE